MVGPFFQAKLIVQGTRIVRSPLYKSLLVSIHVCQFNSQFGHPVWSVKLSFFPAISQLNPHFHLVSTVFCRWKSWTLPVSLGSWGPGHGAGDEVAASRWYSAAKQRSVRLTASSLAGIAIAAARKGEIGSDFGVGRVIDVLFPLVG